MEAGREATDRASVFVEEQQRAVAVHQMMRIRELEQVDLSAVDTLLAAYRYGRYCSPFSGLPVGSSRTYVAQVIRAYCSATSHRCWVADEEGSVQGLLGIRRSLWDTDILGRSVAVVDHLICSSGDYKRELTLKTQLLEQGLDWCNEERVVFLTARADALDLTSIHALQQHSFRYIETTLSNSYAVHRNPALPHSAYSVRPACNDEVDQIADMTRDAFLMHRFAADDRFSTAEINKIYHRWVVDRHEADECHIAVLDVDDTCAGFVLYSLADLTETLGLKFGLWEMAVVSAPFRGKGLGYQLFLATMNDLASEVDIIDSGVTLRNIPSLTLHERLGFRANSMAVTLHRWMD